jgi:hypothetical protein
MPNRHKKYYTITTIHINTNFKFVNAKQAQKIYNFLTTGPVCFNLLSLRIRLYRLRYADSALQI